MEQEPYGYELILDLHGCDILTFNRKSLADYFEKLCEAIDMERCELHFWDDAYLPEGQTYNLPHTKGISAVQFIVTSNITIHTLELLEKVFVNIFSCKRFNKEIARRITEEWFNCSNCKETFIERD